VEPLACPERARGGEPIELSWRVTNRGALATDVSSWVDRVYLSRDPRLDLPDLLLGSEVHDGPLPPSPAAGSSYSVAARFLAPIGASGLYHLLVAADADGHVVESNDGDNLLVKPLPVDIEAAPHADLELVDLRAPATATSGQPLRVEWTVRNHGSEPTQVGEWRDAFYLSQDQVLSRRLDHFLGEAPHGQRGAPAGLGRRLLAAGGAGGALDFAVGLEPGGKRPVPSSSSPAPGGRARARQGSGDSAHPRRR
jgi:hypothetical protein